MNIRVLGEPSEQTGAAVVVVADRIICAICDTVCLPQRLVAVALNFREVNLSHGCALGMILTSCQDYTKITDACAPHRSLK